MSQKRLKKIRREEKIEIKKELVELPGFREIINKNWKFLLLLFLGTIGLFFNSLKGAFVSDDYATIPNNPQIMSFKNGLSGWMGGLINWFLARLFGVDSPIHYHVFSLLVYLLVLLVVFVFVYLILGKKLAMITTILFSVLPVHVETVSWIAGRPYLLNALFVLLSLIFFIFYTKTENKKYILYFFVSAFLTFAAEKTRAAALPLLGILYWISFDHKLKKKINLGKVLLLFSGLFFILIVILWPQMINRIESVNSGTNASDSIFYNPFFQYPTAIAKYLQLIWLPTDLTLYHTMYIVPTWINWLILLVFLSLIGFSFFKDKKMFFALSFIFLATAPSMAPVKISWLVAERYVFLGSLGWCMFLSVIWGKINNKIKTLSMILLILLVLGYSTRTFIRNIDWQTNHNLWVSACQVSPNSHNAWNNIGDDYDKLAQLEKTDERKMNQYLNAVKGFTQSTIAKPNYADAFHNRGNIFYKMGRLDLARDSYLTAISFNPMMQQTYLSLIQMDIVSGNYDLATNDLESLKKRYPNDAQVWYIEAYINIKKGNIDKAKEILRLIVAQIPNFTDAANLLKSIDN